MFFRVLRASGFRSTSLLQNRLRIPSLSSTVQPCRLNHSARQRKRLFDNHPARVRVQFRLRDQPEEQALPPPQFGPVIDDPAMYPNGWNPPPPANVEIPEYPFRVTRTSQKPNNVVGFLPVYSYNKNTKITTRIKKVTGDRELFLQELRSILNLPAPKNPRFDSIRVRSGGTIEVDGNRVRDVKRWLAGLGF